ncbi:unnamed protein product [Notodromas monacha]|uniref:Thioredoxin n=1 Tax=Notodromas monacha TaxID=399045 RepID=A0A7R9GAF1_9CRUS|nr:unnamed protein product [Notodromas monacha]CAG0915294.1 unnamed protein product [Notodromas monacha]
MVREVKTKGEFETCLAEAGSKLVVVDFFATWCGPCKHIAPKIEELESSNPDVVFLKVDIDVVEDLAVDFNISCMPTFLFFKHKTKIDEFSGANEIKIVEIVQKHKN